MFLVELKRGFSRLSFKIAVFIGIIFCLLSLVETKGFSEHLLSDYIKTYLDTPFDRFIFFNLNPVSNILILIFPIISAISYSDSYLEDVNSGFIKAIYTKEKKVKYLILKFLSNFIVAGTAIAAPLLLNFIALILLYPSIPTHAVLGRPTIMPGGLFPGLFYNHPAIYILIWILIYFLYSGAFASIGLSLGILIKNKFVTLIAPFIIYHIASIILQLMNKNLYEPLQFLYLSNNQNISAITLDFVLILIATICLFIYGGYKNETY